VNNFSLNNKQDEKLVDFIDFYHCTDYQKR